MAQGRTKAKSTDDLVLELLVREKKCLKSYITYENNPALKVAYTENLATLNTNIASILNSAEFPLTHTITKDSFIEDHRQYLFIVKNKLNIKICCALKDACRVLDELSGYTTESIIRRYRNELMRLYRQSLVDDKSELFLQHIVKLQTILSKAVNGEVVPREHYRRPKKRKEIAKNKKYASPAQDTTTLGNKIEELVGLINRLEEDQSKHQGYMDFYNLYNEDIATLYLKLEELNQIEGDVENKKFLDKYSWIAFKLTIESIFLFNKKIYAASKLIDEIESRGIARVTIKYERENLRDIFDLSSCKGILNYIMLLKGKLISAASIQLEDKASKGYLSNVIYQKPVPAIPQASLPDAKLSDDAVYSALPDKASESDSDADLSQELRGLSMRCNLSSLV